MWENAEEEGLIMPAIFRSSFPALLFLLASVSLAQPAPDGPPYRVGGNVLRPGKISGEPPTYTPEASRARVTGVVILDALIDEQGNVTDAKVLQGLFTGLDESTVEAVKSWKFKPATLDGRPVAVYYTLTVNYTLGSRPRRAWPFDETFAEENPDLVDLLESKSYPEALALLEGRSGPEARLARAAVLAELGRFDEALAEAQAYDGEYGHVILNYIATAALDAAARPSLDEKTRIGILDSGLEAMTRALAARQDDGDLMLSRSRLLREKAKLTAGPERAALLDEAVLLEKRATKLP
jgi:TonB family protein